MDWSFPIFAVLLIVKVFLVFFTLLPVLRYEAWWVRALDFPRLQLLSISLLMLVLELILLDLSQLSSWGLVVAAISCAGYHAWWIVPYTPLFPVEVQSASNADNQRMIRLMTANVLTSNRNAEALIQLIRDNGPDIVVTMESDEWWQSRLDQLETEYPYTIKCPLDNLYGMHIYSRLPLEDSQIEYLVAPDIPSAHTLACLPSGHQVRLHILHPAPPAPTESDRSTERDAELIIVGKSVAATDEPVIVAGDLNDVAWSETTRLFRKVSGLLDPRIGRGMLNTFHADYWFIRWPLDHLFHSHHFTLSTIRRLPAFGSDHFAILTELVFDFEKSRHQTGLAGDADDIAWANAKIDKKGLKRNDVPTPGQQTATVPHSG